LYIHHTACIPRGLNLYIHHAACIPRGLNLYIHHATCIPRGLILYIHHATCIPRGLNLYIHHAACIPRGFKFSFCDICIKRVGFCIQMFLDWWDSIKVVPYQKNSSFYSTGVSLTFSFIIWISENLNPWGIQSLTERIPGTPSDFIGDNSKSIGLRLFKFVYFSN